MTAHALDTLAVAGRLKAAGFSDAQAEAVTFVLRDANEAGMSDAATKADVLAVKTELQSVRTEVKADILAATTELQGFRTEFRTELQVLRTELKTELQAVRTELKTDVQTHRTETKSEMQALSLRLEARIEAGKTETIKWVISAIGFQTIVLVGAVIAMARLFQP